jgi:hypothetical protein
MSSMRKNVVLHDATQEVDEVLALPHPQREIEFVALAQRALLQETELEPLTSN